jgi:hypothetical protein
MASSDRQISAEIGLPFLKIGTNDVGAFFRRRTRRFSVKPEIVPACEGAARVTHRGNGGMCFQPRDVDRTAS